MITKYLIIGLIGLYVFFKVMGCGGWNEGSGYGTCYFDLVSPLYSGFANLGLVAAFTGFIWVPLLLIVDLIFTRAYKKRKKAAAIAAGTYIEPAASKPDVPFVAFIKKYLIYIIFVFVVVWAIYEFISMY